MKTLILSLTLIAQMAGAQIWDGSQLNQVTLQDITDRVKPGTIVVLGELHGMPEIQARQMELLEALRTKGIPLSIGLEFVNFTDQKFLDDYRSNIITEEEFKIATKWGSGFDFNYYKDQILFPNTSRGETTLGLNVPRAVTSQMGKGGYDSLTVEQKLLLPLDFTVGNTGYRERFSAAVGGHMPPEKLDNYFAAQSAWDEAMAATTVQFVEKHQDHIFVIIVGEFHVQYGGGLPDRLQQRLTQKGLPVDILTVSQSSVDTMAFDQFTAEFGPSPIYGKRSDFIWITKP